MTALWDAKLDPLTHDPVIEGGDLVLISGPEEIAQAIKVALLIFAAEWFLDDTVGWLDFKGMPFGKVTNLNAIRARARQVVQGVGVLSDPPAEITQLTFDRAGRKLTIGFRASVVGDTVTGTVVTP